MSSLGCFYISVINLNLPSDFRDKLWVVLGLERFKTNFQTSRPMLIQEHVLLGKITVTEMANSSFNFSVFQLVFEITRWEHAPISTAIVTILSLSAKM